MKILPAILLGREALRRTSHLLSLELSRVEVLQRLRTKHEKSKVVRALRAFSEHRRPDEARREETVQSAPVRTRSHHTLRVQQAFEGVAT